MGHNSHLTSWRVTNRLALACLCGFVICSHTDAQAQNTPAQKGYYVLQYSGLTLGRVRTERIDERNHYSMSIDTKSKSFAALFSPFQTIAHVEGIKKDGRYLPQHYHSNSYKSDEGDGRSTDITYDIQGNIAKRLRIPLDDAWWRPEVPLSKANAATDPITAYLTLQQKLRRNQDQGIKRTNIFTYDGRRLAKFSVTETAHRRIQFEGKSVSAIFTTIKRTPLDGYTPKEWAKYKKGDPEITANFTDDAKPELLRLDVALVVGKISVVKSEF